MTTHVIELTDDTPFKIEPYRRSLEANNIVNLQIDKYLLRNFIAPSNERFVSPVLLTYRKDSRPRVCIDYRRLNKVTKKSAYPLPRMDSILDALSDAVIISTIDLTDAFHHIPNDTKSREYTAFTIDLTVLKYYF